MVYNVKDPPVGHKKVSVSMLLFGVFGDIGDNYTRTYVSLIRLSEKITDYRFRP